VKKRLGAPLSCLALAAFAACSVFGKKAPEVIPPTPVAAIPGHDKIALDTAPKEEVRLVPAEAYMRTYLQLFGGLAPLEVQRRARGADGAQLFDTWDDYLGALGFPDYRNDLPRGAQTNALMVATFERVGVALCDRALEHDLRAPKPTKGGKPTAPPPLAERLIFAFDPPATKIDAATFAPRFDVLHRTFLGYPAALAPTDRTARFLELYLATATKHAAPGADKSRFSPDEAAWATVCYGLVRHPEFHLY
jgi:hypothetical protein